MRFSVIVLNSFSVIGFLRERGVGVRYIEKSVGWKARAEFFCLWG